jgi:hypothetical protein
VILGVADAVRLPYRFSSAARTRPVRVST